MQPARRRRTPRTSVGRRALRAIGVVGAVEDDERAAMHDLEAARDRDRAEGLLDHVVVERTAEERLGRGQRDRGVVALVRAVQRQEEVVVHVARRAHVDEPAPERGQLRRRSKSSPISTISAGPSASKIGRRSALVLTEHERSTPA